MVRNVEKIWSQLSEWSQTSKIQWPKFHKGHKIWSQTLQFGNAKNRKLESFFLGAGKMMRDSAMQIMSHVDCFQTGVLHSVR